MKKIIILPLGFLMVHILYIGCCKCIEGDFFREFTSFKAIHFSRTVTGTLDTAYVTDTLFASFHMDYNLVARAEPNPFGQLVNAAYATSCHCGGYGDKGYKYPVDSMVIKSDKIFSGVAPGANLVTFFKGYSLQCGGGNPAAYPPFMTIPQLLDSANVCKRYDTFVLMCSSTPGSEKIHNFKYILYSNGKSFEATVKGTVKWQ